MTTASWLTLGLIASFVWGGFLFLLVLALRREAAKEEHPSDPV